MTITTGVIAFLVVFAIGWAIERDMREKRRADDIRSRDEEHAERLRDENRRRR